MKKFILYPAILCLFALLYLSCKKDPIVPPSPEETFKLIFPKNYDVQDTLHSSHSSSTNTIYSEDTLDNIIYIEVEDSFLVFTPSGYKFLIEEKDQTLFVLNTDNVYARLEFFNNYDSITYSSATTPQLGGVNTNSDYTERSMSGISTTKPAIDENSYQDKVGIYFLEVHDFDGYSNYPTVMDTMYSDTFNVEMNNKILSIGPDNFSLKHFYSHLHQNEKINNMKGIEVYWKEDSIFLYRHSYSHLSYTLYKGKKIQ